jgi:hypothetical protein
VYDGGGGGGGGGDDDDDDHNKKNSGDNKPNSQTQHNCLLLNYTLCWLQNTCITLNVRMQTIKAEHKVDMY